MAQVTGGTLFDFGWMRQHDVALKVMVRAADAWAVGGPGALSAEAVLAALLRIYLARWQPKFGDLKRDIELETRDFQSWLELVTTPAAEIATLRPNVDPALATTVLNTLSAELALAIDEWGLGDPEQPPTADAVNVIEHVLFANKLTHRPPRSKLPQTFKKQEPASGA